MLVQNSFVMYDRQTDSLWVHVTGRAFHGPLKGKQLKFLPSTVTTWANWKSSFPHTLVLPGRRRGGLLGTYDGVKNIANLGLSVLVRFKPKLYPLVRLRRQPVVNDRFNGADLLIYYDDGARTATAWGRKVNNRLLTFRLARRRDGFGIALLQDGQTGSLWSWLTGEAVAGPLQGIRLERLTYHPILNDRFKAFYPGAAIFGEAGR